MRERPLATTITTVTGAELEPTGVQALFAPWPVIVEHARLPAEAPAIHADEEAEVSRAVHRRRVEFAAGRACARRALARLGVRDFPLRSEATRAPRWPPGVVGSVTHTGEVPGGYVAVAVAPAGELLALGIDAEQGVQLSAELWPVVLTQREVDWLATQPPAGRDRLARLLFSAKECFYKAQFPLTRRFLGFADVTIAVDEASSTFEARVAEQAFDARLRLCRGRYLDGDEMVVTALAVPAKTWT